MASPLLTTAAPGACFRILTDNGPIDLIVGPAAGAGFVPVNLHDTWWVDAATPVPLGEQTGNDQRPFQSITQAIAAAQAVGDGGPYIIMVVPNFYALEGSIPCPVDHGDLIIQNTSGADSVDKVIIQTIDPTGAAVSNLQLVGIATTQPFDARFAFGLVALGCSFNDCFFSQNTTAQRCGFGALSAQDAVNNLRLVECDLPLTGVQFDVAAAVTIEQTQLPGGFAMNWTVPGGQLRFDNMSWGSFQQRAASANVPATLISNEAQTFSPSDLALAADPAQSFAAYTFGSYPVLLPSSFYFIEYTVEVLITKDADHSVTGQVDFKIQASVATDIFGTATTTFNTAPAPDVTLLPAGLAGATASIVASANGWTVQAQRPAGVDCHARYVVKWNKVENVT